MKNEWKRQLAVLARVLAWPRSVRFFPDMEGGFLKWQHKALPERCCLGGELALLALLGPPPARLASW